MYTYLFISIILKDTHESTRKHTQMTHTQMWYTHRYDTHTDVTHTQVWHTHRYDTHTDATHTQMTDMTHTQMWHTHRYDTHTDMSHTQIWHTHRWVNPCTYVTDSLALSESCDDGVRECVAVCCNVLQCVAMCALRVRAHAYPWEILSFFFHFFPLENPSMWDIRAHTKRLTVECVWISHMERFSHFFIFFPSRIPLCETFALTLRDSL